MNVQQYQEFILIVTLYDNEPKIIKTCSCFLRPYYVLLFMKTNIVEWDFQLFENFCQ